MSSGAIIMMVLALSITWGGAAICIAIAIKKRNKRES
ncbi:methionine/alanine import family NSS transporter small subunit [Shewanella atlantica]|uniref:Methionine/alanine import family NSS transporter small subunit n=1 Tax=Shewanella atlantica TaxID=271099 RepID=A0A3S0KL25_9GAMM|nr:methionine/alanine import family NSS transporter small subunit [Shewanella atlantica]RTR32912.1 methionine/alanine import family NSS transporter small subunit [Shewanella atlantica]